MQVSGSRETELGLNTPPGVRIMLKSWAESEWRLYPVWGILSAGFETDMIIVCHCVAIPYWSRKLTNQLITAFPRDLRMWCVE